MQIFVQRDGGQVGPYSEEEVHEFLKQGVFKTDDFAWTEGTEDWEPLEEIFPDAVLVETQPKAGTQRRGVSRLRIAFIAVAGMAMIGGAVSFWTANQRNRATPHPSLSLVATAPSPAFDPTSLGACSSRRVFNPGKA
jgi:hypothetical protein